MSVTVPTVVPLICTVTPARVSVFTIPVTVPVTTLGFSSFACTRVAWRKIIKFPSCTYVRLVPFNTISNISTTFLSFIDTEILFTLFTSAPEYTNCTPAFSFNKSMTSTKDLFSISKFNLTCCAFTVAKSDSEDNMTNKTNSFITRIHSIDFGLPLNLKRKLNSFIICI